MNILEYENQIISDAQQYQAKISRDIWGVPHISGARDADVAFGLAFAHAEDDIKNIIKTLKFVIIKWGINKRKFIYRFIVTSSIFCMKNLLNS